MTTPSLKQTTANKKTLKTKDMKKTFTNHFLTKCLLAFLAILLVPSSVCAEELTAVCSTSYSSDAYFWAEAVEGGTIGTEITPWTLTPAASGATSGSTDLYFYSNSVSQWNKVSFNVTVDNAATITIADENATGSVSEIIAAGGTATLELTYSNYKTESGTITISTNAQTTITFNSITLYYELQPLEMSWSTYNEQTQQETTYTEDNPYNYTISYLNETISSLYFNWSNDFVQLSEISFSSSDETVATITVEEENYSPTITALKPGSTVITASFAGNDYFLTTTAPFKLNVIDGRPASNLAFETETATTNYSPSSDIVTGVNSLTYAMDTMSVVVTTSDPTVAQVVKVSTDDGTSGNPASSITLGQGYTYGLKILKAGTATITATYPGGDYYTTGEASYTLTVSPLDVSLLEDGIQYSGLEKSYTYTGSEIKPEPTITISEKELTKDTDYTLSYQNNINVPAAGSNDVPMIVVTFKGNYTGTSNCYFDITQGAASITTAPAAIADLTYTGEPQALISAGVSNFGDVVYSDDENGNYSTDIPTATNAAEYTIWYKVVATENYTGTTAASVTATISPATATITAKAQTSTYTAEAIEYDIDNVSISPASIDKEYLMYEYYAENPSQVTTSQPQPLEVAPTDAGTYYVQISLSNDLPDYSAESVVTTLTIRKATPEVSVSMTGWTYGATANTPAITDASNPGNGAVTYTYKVKDANDDTYSETVPTTAGNYTVKATIAETTNYASASGTADFTISKATPKITTTPKAVADLVYDGSEKTLVSAGETTGGTMQYAIGSEGTYSADLPKATNAGIYQVYYKVVGGDNYEDIEASYLTVLVDSANITASAENVEVTYDGEAHGITVNVTVPTDNYTIKYSEDNQSYSATKPTVTDVTSQAKTVWYQVIAANYYTYTGYATITITANTSTLTVTQTGTASSYTYTGEAITPEITVTSGSKTLTATTDYTVEYTNNTNVGEATITVTGVGNYAEATGSATFSITAKSIESTTIGEIAAQAYTGKAITPAVTVKDGNVTLTEDTDYTVTYENNTAVGTATITITGKGNYTGTNQTSFAINTQLDITFASGQTWATYVSTLGNLTVPTGLKAYVVSSVSGSTVTVSEINYLPANMAVLIEKTSEAGETFTVEAYPEEVPEELGNQLKATTAETAVTSNIYVLYNNEFRRATTGSIPAYRGYLVVEGNAGARLTIIEGESATAIGTIAVNFETDQWYTLEGRKLDRKPTTPGCYIWNGKKIYVSKK